MKEYALMGRTIGATYYDTYGEAYTAYLELDPSIVTYDGEVAIYRWNGKEWVDARRRGMPEYLRQIKERIKEKERNK